MAGRPTFPSPGGESSEPCIRQATAASQIIHIRLSSQAERRIAARVVDVAPLMIMLLLE
jgi:hypothetical protein